MESKNEYKKAVEYGQDIYDLCIQEYGSLNTLFLLLNDNPQLDLKRNLVAGELVKFRVILPADVPVNKNLMDDYRNNQTRVNNHDEVETLEDGCPILTSDGFYILTANNVVLLLVGCDIEAVDEPEILSGILTSDGEVMVISTGDILLPEREPVLASATGFSLLTALGEEIQIEPEDLVYITTADEFYIQASNNDFIIL